MAKIYKLSFHYYCWQKVNGDAQRSPHTNSQRAFTSPTKHTHTSMPSNQAVTQLNGSSFHCYWKPVCPDFKNNVIRAKEYKYLKKENAIVNSKTGFRLVIIGLLMMLVQILEAVQYGKLLNSRLQTSVSFPIKFIGRSKWAGANEQELEV